MRPSVIAVIEDDAAVLDVITECLSNEGYRTLAYRQAAGAYEFVEYERPDAVILDIRMEHPRAGLGVLQRLRRDPATGGIPVLVCTADEQFASGWQRTLADLRSTVITKPFDIAALLMTVEQILSPPEHRTDKPPSPNGRIITQPMPPAPAIRPVVGLVDTDGRGLTVFAEQMDRKGYKTVSWHWGNRLYDMVVREQPDVLAVDTRDTRREVVAHVLRRLRRDPLTRHVPILVNPHHECDLYRTVAKFAWGGDRDVVRQ